VALYTKAQLLTEVRTLLDEPVARRWTDTNLNEMIDWGARTTSGITLCTPETESVAMASGENALSFAITAQFLDIQSCSYFDGSTTVPLIRADIRHYGRGAGTSGEAADTARVPIYWYTFAQKLFLWPLPKGSALNTATANLSGWRVAEDYAHGSTVYDIPDRLQGKLIDFVLACAYTKTGNFSLVSAHMTQFIQSMQFDRSDVHDRLERVESHDMFMLPDRTIIQNQ
jgi:hypothetical protein